MLKLKRGYLVAFEGIDGTGKSTHCRWLEEELICRGIPVERLREPTDGIWGKKIRQLLNEGRGKVSLEKELTWFMNDRREDVENHIGPALESKKFVLMDRYYYSTAAYQGAGGLEPEKIVSDNEIFAPVPDRVFIFHAPVDTCLERIKMARGDYLDSFEKKDYLEKVQTIFESFSGPRFCKIDSSVPVQAVRENVMQGVQDLLLDLNLG